MKRMVCLFGLMTFLFAGLPAQAEVRLQGAGSTFVTPMMQRWVTEYQRLHPDVQIDYQSIGSGGGVKGFIEKTVAFGASDAPLSHKEFDKAGGADKVVQIPVVAGAVVAGYNIPGLWGELRLHG